MILGWKLPILWLKSDNDFPTKGILELEYRSHSVNIKFRKSLLYLVRVPFAHVDIAHLIVAFRFRTVHHTYPRENVSRIFRL